jgi:hypothetical protein
MEEERSGPSGWAAPLRENLRAMLWRHLGRISAESEFRSASAILTEGRSDSPEA